MSTAVIIPVRLGSTRLERKPLRLILGISLIERVYRQVSKSSSVDSIIIAADSNEIRDHCRSFGAAVVMTSSDHTSGTLRVAEAARSLPSEFDIVINVQGDEPLIEPDIITSVAHRLQTSSSEIVTAVTQFSDEEERNDPHCVKAVCASDRHILYFSRSCIPYVRPSVKIAANIFHKHLGIYGFRRNMLENISQLPPCILEEVEGLEQLRWLDAGLRIDAVEVTSRSIGVDTENDLNRVEAILKEYSE
jgi:3-deoxy-manno-octulosonate cytidylyltransferase (CMP-KDO synthetase)